MKNILKYISVAFVGGLIFASCEKSRPVVYTGEKFVAFEDTLLTIAESSAKEDANGEVQTIPSIATIRINRGTGDISKDLVVSFSVKAKYVSTDPNTGDEIEGADVPAGSFYLSSPGAVTIKAGEGFAFITITIVDNDLTDGNKKLTFTIESASDASFTLGYPGPDKKAKSMDLYIEDDDCPLNIADFVGTLKVEDVAIASPPLQHSYSVVSTQVSPISISITGLFDATTRYPSPTPCPAPVTLVFNVATKDVIFSPNTQVAYYRSGGCPATTNPRVVYPDPGVPNKLNTCRKRFTLNYYVQNPAASGPFDFVQSVISKP